MDNKPKKVKLSFKKRSKRLDDISEYMKNSKYYGSMDDYIQKVIQSEYQKSKSFPNNIIDWFRRRFLKM